MYNQRDIVLIPFPYSDLSAAKQRPALIISNKKINKTEDRICCLVTSNPAHDGLMIKENCFEQDKLPFQSWIKSHRLFTIHEKIIKRKLCTITEKLHEDVLQTLKGYLELG